MGKSGNKMLGFLIKVATWESRWVVNRDLGEGGQARRKQFDFCLGDVKWTAENGTSVRILSHSSSKEYAVKTSSFLTGFPVKANYLHFVLIPSIFEENVQRKLKK